ncbi:anti-repressor SinI family protein [Litchfieldia alkalitelluris]
MVKEVEKGLDVEWIALILEAKNLGLSVEDVQSFLLKGHNKA